MGALANDLTLLYQILDGCAAILTSLKRKLPVNGLEDTYVRLNVGYNRDPYEFASPSLQYLTTRIGNQTILDSRLARG